MSVQAILTEVPSKTIITVVGNSLKINRCNVFLDSGGYKALKTSDLCQTNSICGDDGPDLLLLKTSFRNCRSWR